MRQKGRPTQVQLGNLLIDFTRYEVWRDGTLIPLTPREFDLLAALAEQPGRVFTRLELLEQVFGFDYEGLERTVDTHVMNLRKKIEPDATRPLYVQTVHGRGYRLMVAG
jgi:DNA-binding response OmpR family regulator